MEPKKIDLAKIMLAYLKKQFTAEQKFSAVVLYNVARSYGQSPRTGANNQLRKLMAAGLVKRTGTAIKNQNGGSDMPLYQLTSKAFDEPAPKKSQSSKYQATAAEEFNRMNECQLNLQAILNNITRGRQLAA